MPKASDILGMNARNQMYTSQNSSSAIRFGTSKYATKVLLENKGIPTAKVFGILGAKEDITDFPWETMEKNFVIKPSNGNAGKGIMIIKRQEADKTHWTNTLGQRISLEEITLHCYDILEGQYSTYGTTTHVIVEERVPIHSKLLKYAYKGTPDIRVIVFNHVPVMAMLRLPTKESEGRANLHQGAIGVGIDMFSGITTHAITGKGDPITTLPPDFKRKVNGIKIPNWSQLLLTAVTASDAAGLIFSGVDLFIHEEKGPLVVELNANPGLSIQLANRSGLRRRLDRVTGLNVLNPEHGVKIGQSLFAENFSDKIKAEDGLSIVSPFEQLEVFGSDRQKHTALALMNTGRFRSAISTDLAKRLGAIDIDDLLWYQQEQEGRVPVVEVTFKLKDRKIKTAMVVSRKLDKVKHNMEIGRKDLAGFLVGEHE